MKAHQTVYRKAHRIWPVGQVVKTAASHAVNIVSNPVRVTIIFRHIFVAARNIIYIVGADYYEGPPVPIPNTEVKLVCAENTLRETAREDR